MYAKGVHQKPYRQVDKEWLKKIKKRKCLASFSPKGHVCVGPVTPAHLRTRGSNGSDYTAVPLCVKSHGEQESHTDQWFWEKYQIDLWKELCLILLETFTAQQEDDRETYVMLEE